MLDFGQFDFGQFDFGHTNRTNGNRPCRLGVSLSFAIIALLKTCVCPHSVHMRAPSPRDSRLWLLSQRAPHNPRLLFFPAREGKYSQLSHSNKTAGAQTSRRLSPNTWWTEGTWLPAPGDPLLFTSDEANVFAAAQARRQLSSISCTMLLEHCL